MSRIRKMQAIIRRQLNTMQVYAHNEEVANEQAALAAEMLNDVQSEAYKLRAEREEWARYIKRISDMYDASEAVRKRQAAEIAELRQYKEMYEGLCSKLSTVKQICDACENNGKCSGHGVCQFQYEVG